MSKKEFSRRQFIESIPAFAAFMYLRLNGSDLGKDQPKVPEQEAIKLSDRRVENTFRQNMTFQVAAESPTGANIVSARMILKTDGSAASKIFPAEHFDPSSKVSLKAVWDTRQEQTPPWQVWSNHWEILDDKGNLFQSPVEKTEMSDDTHPWTFLEDGHVRTYWYGLSADLGKKLLQSAQAGFDHVSKATGYTPKDRLVVDLYPNQEGYFSFMPTMNKQSAGWEGGQTIDNMTVQWLEDKASGEAYTLNEVVPHELAHAFLADRMSGRQDMVPHWFNEGQAVNNQLAGVREAIARAREIAQENNLIRLQEMEYHSNDTNQEIDDWYDQATSLVAFLYDKFGLTVLGKIIDPMTEGQNFEAALKSATQLSLADYEQQWRAWLGAPPLSDAQLNPTPTPGLEFPPTPIPGQ